MDTQIIQSSKSEGRGRKPSKEARRKEANQGGSKGRMEVSNELNLKTTKLGTSLAVQWLRLYFPVQEA